MLSMENYYTRLLRAEALLLEAGLPYAADDEELKEVCDTEEEFEETVEIRDGIFTAIEDVRDIRQHIEKNSDLYDLPGR